VWTRKQLEAKARQPSDVPCGDCRACCKHDRIFLGPRDDPGAYRWHVEDGYAVLDRTASGECVYLTPKGCSIHGRAPEICRRMDCRVLFLLTPAEVQQRRCQENPQMASVYEAGRRRLPSLDDEG
jgi:Fe-S-cluster containining protein